MSTSSTVRAWSNTDATNSGTDANITSSDSQSPDTLDNNVRSIMAAVHKNMDDLGGALTAGGSANALTVTTEQVLESGQLVAGLRICLKAASTNTSAAVTFAPDGLTAVAIKRADGTALAVGSIQAGAFLDLVYNTGTSEWWGANIGPGGNAPGSVQASFSAYLNASQGFPQNVATKLQLGSTEWNVGSFYNTGTYRWTPPAGTVLLTAVAQGSFANAFTVSIYKNGSVYKTGDTLGAGSVLATAMAQANGTDYFEIFLTTNQAGNPSPATGAANTFFQGTMV